MTKKQERYINFVTGTCSHGISALNERMEDNSALYVNDILRYDESGEVYINNYVPNMMSWIDYDNLY